MLLKVSGSLFAFVKDPAEEEIILIGSSKGSILEIGKNGHFSKIYFYNEKNYSVEIICVCESECDLILKLTDKFYLQFTNIRKLIFTCKMFIMEISAQFLIFLSRQVSKNEICGYNITVIIDFYSKC